MDVPADWTQGAEAITFQSCGACGRRWYFHRAFCPHCGAPDVTAELSSGIGTVYAVTVVERAPSPEWRDRAPYGLCLIDLDEGPRVMTHGELQLKIGDRVKTAFVRIGTAVIPIAQAITA